MNFGLTLVALLGIFIATTIAMPPPNASGFAAQPPPPPTLTQDLEELYRMVPTKLLTQLVRRYLLNDNEFQSVVRTINSYDAFIVRMRFFSQPEVIAFNAWSRTQMMLSGGSMEWEESTEIMDLFNSSPYWANTVYGWQGFMNELTVYYPQELIRAHIDMKALQNGIFAEYWMRLKGLRVVYERVLTYPESQRLIAKLQSQGVDINQLDQLIRRQFDWFNATTTATAAVMAPTADVAVHPSYGGAVILI